MGRRDKRQRESKKPKKDTKPSLMTTIVLPPAVEVVRKGKKERQEED